jgi:hypothetical protein
MQIPSSAIAASVTSITASKAERAQTTETASSNTQLHVESSNQSNPDRDAQGQGDGMGPRHPGKRQSDAEFHDDPVPVDTAAPTLPDEPSSLLDLLG